MSKFIAQRVISKSQPMVVFVCGTWGKSMAIDITQKIFEKAGIRTGIAENAESIEKAVKVSASGSLLKALFSRSFPEILFIELTPETELNRALFDLIERKALLIPSISEYEIAQYGNLTKYLQKRFFLNKKITGSTEVLFNRDIPNLSEALDDLGVEKKNGFAVETELADLTITNLENREADDAHISNDHRIQGMTYKVKNGGSILPVRFTGGIGKQHIYSVLAAISLAKKFDVNLIDSISVIRDYRGLPGRMRLIPGIKKTLLLDDTYNIDAESALTALQVASQVPLREGKHRIAVLGDMFSYGEDSEKAHCLLGDEIAGLSFDAIVGIGERMEDTLRCAKEAGMDENTLFHFADPVEAGKFVQHELKQGDFVVVKGSKEMKLESVIKELMAFPLKAKEDLLQR
jgi:UDP-N-acetylmuramoyl-tripeptide--D-alanyl-D-alanine ligase